MRAILEASALRRSELTLCGELLVAHEPPATAFTILTTRRKSDPTGAYAALFHEYIRKPDGSHAFTLEEAEQIAKGSPRVFTPLVVALTNYMEDEKKALEQLIASDTGSPSPSAEPSMN